jgi:hypothetical protein
MRSFLALVGFTLALAACGGPRLSPYTPLEKKSELQPKVLYDAAEGVLLDRGYLIDKRDPAGFELRTQPRTLLGSQIAQNKYKYVWSVHTGGGSIRIELSCKEASGSGDASDCGAEVPAKLVAEQRAIYDQTVDEAKQK